MKYSNVDIDLVCCWVTLDEEYQSSVDKYSVSLDNKSAVNKARFRELGELEYSVPAALKNLPWIRKIFIITNGQIPPKKVMDLPNVELITHDEIFKFKEHLPTFSYHAIMPHLCFIEGLAENFIIMSDDFFITKPMKKKDFLGNNGLGVFMHTKKSLSDFTTPENVWQSNLSMSHQSLSEKLGDFDRKVFPHAPQLFKKSKAIEVFDKYNKDLYLTSSQKFRNESNVIFRILYTYSVMYDQWGKHDYDELIKLSDGDVGYFDRKTYRVISLRGAGKGNWQSELEMAITDRPQFLCLNDNILESDYSKAAPFVRKYLLDIYSN